MSTRAERLHSNPYLGVILITGGGSAFLSELMGTPGASATLLEARIPYAYQSLTEILGGRPEQACSAATAQSMAMAAFERALEFGTASPFGLACTASLATNREKKGPCRAHVALQTTHWAYALDVQFDGDDRASQETELVDAIWQLCAPLNGETAPPGTRSIEALSGWADVATGRVDAWPTKPHDGLLLVPGSFNPCHRGHAQLLDTAESLLGRPGALELSLANVDKPLTDYHSLQERFGSIEDHTDAPVWLTRLPTFIEKARHFPGTTFAVGADTMARIDQAKYYGTPQARDAAIRELAELETRFLVFGRLNDEDFVTLKDLPLSAPLRALCEAVPESLFRIDLSSTQIRRARQSDTNAKQS